jgi:hypothetical protein
MNLLMTASESKTSAVNQLTCQQGVVGTWPTATASPPERMIPRISVWAIQVPETAMGPSEQANKTMGILTLLRYTAAHSTKQVPGPLTRRTSTGKGPLREFLDRNGTIEAWYMQNRSDHTAVGGVAHRDWCTRRARGTTSISYYLMQA